MNTLLIIIILILVVGKGFKGIAELVSNASLVFSRVAKVFGWAGKRIRKISVELEFQGTINSIVHDYNKNFQHPVLPDCKISWMTDSNRESFLKNGEAIICLSFDRKDHNLNFFNAVLNYVQTALFPVAKFYLQDSYSKAIDLLTTHIILRNYRREVMSTFHSKLRDYDKDTIKEFEALAPTNDRGLFQNILIPEFHFYGDLILTLPPSIEEFKLETKRLLVWFKELATRGFEDRTNLKFVSKNIKVGVILVGKDETWNTQGASAYTKWATYYSHENYNSVYLLARGKTGHERAAKVCKILTSSKGFDQINRNAVIKCVSPEDGSEYIVTCYALRPNKATVAFLGWKSFSEYKLKGDPVPAIVENVYRDKVIVSAFGLIVEVAGNLMSDRDISDLNKFFRVEDELYLDILELDIDTQHVVLSNKGAISDPNKAIAAVLSESRDYSCPIEKFCTNQQGRQTGLIVSCREIPNQIFIPRSKATPSRFLDLQSKYSINELLTIKIEKFDAHGSNFIGCIIPILDPWQSENLANFCVSSKISVIVRQISEFSLVCEIEEGLECILPVREISWLPKDCTSKHYKVADRIDVIVTSIEHENKRIYVSIRRLTKSVEYVYFESNRDLIVEVEIVEIEHGRGMSVRFRDDANLGYIEKNEVGHGPTWQWEDSYHVGKVIQAVVFKYMSGQNRISFSIRKKYVHQYIDWVDSVLVGSCVKGKIVGHFRGKVQVELESNSIIVQGVILNKHISKHAYVTDSDSYQFLPMGDFFHFYIREYSDSYETVYLDRIDYLRGVVSPPYDAVIDLRYVKCDRLKGYFYSDNLEGWVDRPSRDLKIGSIVQLHPISNNTGEFSL